MLFTRKSLNLPSPDAALAGREQPIPTSETHFVNGRDLKAAPPPGYETLYLGMGCFWGAERLFWQTEGVWLTAVGYAGGYTPNPTYREVCTGRTGHTEIVKLIYDPAVIDLEGVLKLFWEGHDPTQGMRQGNDVGTQYRSAVYTADDGHVERAEASRKAYADALAKAGHGETITTEIKPLDAFYHAEAEHQQYLAKNPHGYCGIGGTGITCPIGTNVGL